MKFSRHTALFLTLFSLQGFNPEVARAYSIQEISALITPQEARIEQYRSAQIKQMELVLQRSAAREQMPEFLLQLSQWYTERAQLYFAKENQIWNKKIDAFLQTPPERQKYATKPVLDQSQSRKYQNAAVALLEKIPQQKVKFDRLDEVYYFLGLNRWETGKKKEAAQAFGEIIENFPRSRFLSEAYRYSADYAFANRDFRRSREYYERAVKSAEPVARPKILYGLAWSRYKLQDYKGAMNTMHEAIKLGRENDEAGKVGLSIQRDAAESLALFYSEAGSVDEAARYFGALFSENESLQVLRKLAAHYQEQGKYAKALSINKQLLSMGGAAAKEGQQQRFEIMVDSLNVSVTKGDRTRQTALLKSMTTEFVTNADPADPEKVETLRNAVRKAALLAHKEAQKSGTGKPALTRAEELYHLYLTAFGPKAKEEDIAEIRFYLADVQSQLGRHREAAADYKALLDLSGENSAYKKYAKDSAAGMVFALDNYFKAQGDDAKQISKADADQVIGAVDSYAKQFPKDKDTTKYLARAAGILVTSERMDEARPRLMDIIEKYPNSQEAWDAAATLLKDAEDHKDYAAAKELSQKFLGSATLMAQDKKGEFKKRLESIVDRAQFQQVRKQEESKDFGSAAEGYEKLAAESKDSEVKNKALNNAAISYQKNGDRDNELRLYKKILESDPGNEQAEKNILAIGNDHFLSGRYDDAATIFETYFGLYEKRLGSVKPASQKLAMESIRSAALLRRAMRQSDQAASDFARIVEAANKGIGVAKEAAGEFLFEGAKRLKDEGNTPEAIRGFQKYASAFPDGPHAIGATMETAELYGKLREEEKSQNYLRTVISKVKAKGGKASAEEKGYAAQSRLVLLGPLEEEFESKRLSANEQKLKAEINEKLQALERLNKGYIEVMDFGDGTWGVEAFRRMAMAYRTFGRTLENAPIPESYSPEDKAKFRAQTKNAAAPVYQKMRETLDTALQKGEQLQVTGPVMARAYILSTLNTAKPDRLPLVQTINWDRAGDWIMGSTPTTDAELEAARKALRAKQDDANLWVAIGNRHLLGGQSDFAEIFYLYAAQKNPKHVAAINNLAYLRGKEGDFQKAMAGFKTALGIDEFAVAPKKNMARLQMSSGLWRHAAQNYRQLEVRQPNDREIKRGLALSALALGKSTDAGLLASVDGENGRFAEAIYLLAKGDRAGAAAKLNALAGSNEYAKLITDFWNTKEND